MLNCSVWRLRQVLTQLQTHPSTCLEILGSGSGWTLYSTHCVIWPSLGTTRSRPSPCSPPLVSLLSLVLASTSLPSHPEGLCHHVDPILWLRTTGLDLRNRSSPTPISPFQPHPPRCERASGNSLPSSGTSTPNRFGFSTPSSWRLQLTNC